MLSSTPLEQSSAGVKPHSALIAEVRVDRLKVLVDEGVMPWFDSQVYVGSVWNNLTTVWKKATASAPLGLPLGKQDGTRVLMQVPWVDHSCSQKVSSCPLISTQNVCIKSSVALAPWAVKSPAMFV